MSYTVQAVINRADKKAKTFKDYSAALRFIQKILDQHRLQVRTIIERDSVEEYVCDDHASRIIVSAVR